MCDEQMKRLISGHLDGCNTEKQEATLTAHLQECAECHRLLNEYKAIDSALSELTLSPPAGFSADVMGAISQETPRPPKAKKHSFRYGTMIAAAAAVLILAVSAGHIALPKGGAAAIYPSAADKAVTEESAAEAPAEATEEESYATADMEQTTLETKTASGNASANSANVDCAALAETEGCYVGLLYADSIPEALKHTPSTPLSDGNMYAVSQDILMGLKEQYPELEIFSPQDTVPDDGKDAYLIFVNDPS